MKLNLVVEIEDRDVKKVSENAIERVINTSIALASRSKHPDSFTNEDDWKVLKPFVVNLWARLQDAIFRQVNGIDEQQKPDQEQKVIDNNVQRELDYVQSIKDHIQKLKDEQHGDNV